MPSNERLYLGVEIGGTKLQVALGTSTGKVLNTGREQVPPGSNADAILAQVKRMVGDLRAAHDVVAVGVGFGGPVDETQGRVIKSHQVGGWEDVPLAARLAETCRCPCVLGNDTNCATVAEAVAGAGRGFDPVFYTNIGSGIGGGLFTRGELYTGRYGAMEIGHTWVHSAALGRSDRLEDLCSGFAIARRARETIQASSLGSPTADNGNPDAAAVARAWLGGDPAATELMEDVIASFAQALCNVIALTNPQVLILGGGVALVGEPLFRALTDSVQRQLLFRPFAQNFRLVPARLGEEAVPVGALLLAARTDGGT